MIRAFDKKGGRVEGCEKYIYIYIINRELRINLNVEGCGIVAAPVHVPSRTFLLLPLLLSHNLPLPRVHKCVMGRLFHTGLGSSSLVAHVLHYPPPLRV
jgi:hypothetical protein